MCIRIFAVFKWRRDSSDISAHFFFFFFFFFFFSRKRIPDQAARMHRLILILAVLIWRRDISQVAAHFCQQAVVQIRLHECTGLYRYSLFSCGVGTFCLIVCVTV